MGIASGLSFICLDIPIVGAIADAGWKQSSLKCLSHKKLCFDHRYYTLRRTRNRRNGPSKHGYYTLRTVRYNIHASTVRSDDREFSSLAESTTPYGGFCALENGADLHVNERQKIRHYCARSTEERRRIRRRRRKKKKNAKSRFSLLRAVLTTNCAIIAMLYTQSIGIRL